MSVPPIVMLAFGVGTLPNLLAAGAVAAGGTLGILIPPSLILMIYAIIAQQSVSKLFAAALVPGLILTALYIVVVQVMDLVKGMIVNHWAPPRMTRMTAAARLRTGMKNR